MATTPATTDRLFAGRVLESPSKTSLSSRKPDHFVSGSYFPYCPPASQRAPDATSDTFAAPSLTPRPLAFHSSPRRRRRSTDLRSAFLEDGKDCLLETDQPHCDSKGFSLPYISTREETSLPTTTFLPPITPPSTPTEDRTHNDILPTFNASAPPTPPASRRRPSTVFAGPPLPKFEILASAHCPTNAVPQKSSHSSLVDSYAQVSPLTSSPSYRIRALPHLAFRTDQQTRLERTTSSKPLPAPFSIQTSKSAEALSSIWSPTTDKWLSSNGHEPLLASVVPPSDDQRQQLLRHLQTSTEPLKGPGHQTHSQSRRAKPAQSSSSSDLLISPESHEYYSTVEDVHHEVRDAAPRTRYARVYGVPIKLGSTLAGLRLVLDAFQTVGKVRDIYMEALPTHGFVLVSFLDIKSVAKLQRLASSSTVAGMSMAVEPVERWDVEQLSGGKGSSLLSPTEGALVLIVQGLVTRQGLHDVLARHGPLSQLNEVASWTWEAEWEDEEHAYAAASWLQTARFPNVTISVVSEGKAAQGALPNAKVHGALRPDARTVTSLPQLHQLQQQVTAPSSVRLGNRRFPFPGVPAHCVIDIDRIELGWDPRTTLMIKNVPNKLSIDMLERWIWDAVPRSFDFLRVDFESRANVGYGFVSFRTVEHLLAFCLLRLGAPWGCFNTAKTLQASYASIQGKESLVAKFRNSAVMSQPEPFRPRVYASHGPRAGLPEEFPPPNDLLRKARSTASILSSQSQSTFG